MVLDALVSIQIHLPFFTCSLCIFLHALGLIFHIKHEHLKCKPCSLQNLGQSYTPVNGWRDMLHPDSSSDPSDPPLPPVWDWPLQYSKHRRDRFTQPVPPVPPLQPLLNGNLNTNPDSHRVGWGRPLVAAEDTAEPCSLGFVLSPENNTLFPHTQSSLVIQGSEFSKRTYGSVVPGKSASPPV